LKDTNARQPRSERRDTTHRLTTDLTKTYRKIGIEDLNVRGMAAQNRSYPMNRRTVSMNLPTEIGLER
jgi:transposase